MVRGSLPGTGREMVRGSLLATGRAMVRGSLLARGRTRHRVEGRAGRRAGEARRDLSTRHR